MYTDPWKVTWKKIKMKCCRIVISIYSCCSDFYRGVGNLNWQKLLLDTGVVLIVGFTVRLSAVVDSVVVSMAQSISRDRHQIHFFCWVMLVRISVTVLLCDICRSDNVVLLSHSCVLLHVLWFFCVFSSLCCVNGFSCFFFHHADFVV